LMDNNTPIFCMRPFVSRSACCDPSFIFFYFRFPDSLVWSQVLLMRRSLTSVELIPLLHAVFIFQLILVLVLPSSLFLL
jgi:hypothetical protein